jgi:hypothetical protein
MGWLAKCSWKSTIKSVSCSQAVTHFIHPACRQMRHNVCLQGSAWGMDHLRHMFRDRILSILQVQIVLKRVHWNAGVFWYGGTEHLLGCAPESHLGKHSTNVIIVVFVVSINITISNQVCMIYFPDITGRGGWADRLLALLVRTRFL